MPQSQMPLLGSVCPANEVSGRQGGESVRGKEEADGKGPGGQPLGSVTPVLAAGSAPTLGAGVTSHPPPPPPRYDPPMTGEGERRVRSNRVTVSQ